MGTLSTLAACESNCVRESTRKRRVALSQTRCRWLGGREPAWRPGVGCPYSIVRVLVSVQA